MIASLRGLMQRRHSCFFALLLWGGVAIAQTTTDIAPDALPALLAQGRLAAEQGQLEQALTTLTAVFEQAQSAADESIRLAALNSLANLYYESGQLDAARRYYLELVALDRARGDNAALATTLFNLGHVYASANELTEADAVFSESLVLSRQIDDLAGQAYALKALGVSAHAQMAPAVAEQHLVDAARAFEQLNEPRQLAAVYRHLGDIAADGARHVEAIDWYQKALPYLQNNLLVKPLMRLYRGLAEAYGATGDFERAYLTQQAYSLLLQEDLEQSGAEALQRLQVAFETRRFADENRQLELTNASQARELASRQERLRLQTAVLVLLALVVILAVVLWRRSRSHAEHMQALATIDPLTQLLNRRAIYELGTAECQRAQRYRHSMTVLLFDIDHFKSINDGFGHGVGDEVLQRVASVAAGSIRETDALGRIGGEEFLVICAETSAEEAVLVAERIRTALEACTYTSMPGRAVTTSIGVAARRDDEALEALVNRADEALYAAKSGGRNRVVVASLPSQLLSD